MQATTERPPAPPKTFQNEAAWDRGVRILLGVVLLYLGWSGVVTGAWGNVFRYLGFVPLLTGLVGWCPLYHALGWSTRRA
jgi:hypothetical protein